MIDEFAVGLGNDGVPSGWGTGPLDDATKRHALGWAVYEVGMSPVTDAPDLDDDYFTVWYKPDEQTNAFALATGLPHGTRGRHDRRGSTGGQLRHHRG